MIKNGKIFVFLQHRVVYLQERSMQQARENISQKKKLQSAPEYQTNLRAIKKCFAINNEVRTIKLSVNCAKKKQQ